MFHSQLCTPTEITVVFNNVVYVIDFSTGSIKLITPLKRTAEFLDALQSLAKAFPLMKSMLLVALKQ